MKKFNRDWPTQNRADPAAWLEAILAWGQAEYFSDFYFVAQGKRYRLTGKQQEELFFLDELANDFAKRVLLVIKYRAALYLTEDRRPQLGRFDFQAGFIRVSTVGDFLDRESLVLRLIYPQLGKLFWHFPAQWHDLVTQKIENGLLVIAGPTGSGKTTTLYRLLESWAKRQMVLTVEDPVEIHQPDFLQLQVNELAGIGYPDLIKVALRHRPDILVIGEIRDLKTAQAALDAALSGHLVLTTLHANSEIGVLSRLVNLGLDERRVREALSKTVYQRLLKIGTGPVGVLVGLRLGRTDR
ncbi:type II secretory pathway/competence component, ATPase [Fructobacillus pseudoficulneus]|uniref:Type II secretory pathway/competence component, ATPase n=1 Tax=Fructobacillus pseudoficulneus TaxID=220714 RepID=A0A3F3GVY3_9LACO|nr:ATPase, T2SS/T4P/T4SS family [Fructobacillus pseudoficulneus]GAP02477.1 type II secretory pathway/competence component, ATPase [Fructobacillus pseudoficulneus]SEH37151.1 competence protein ComGA [Fructobacillus pseudoficulneus]